MRVIGTAGHVDHGKSTLIEALTGIHPDRLKEEREREMTIDLGFAWLKLPGNEEVGIIDVPGHRDFIENMLAGIGGIDAALFVVAADEGVMPQTREHLAILDLLQIQGGVVALTKIDLVEGGDGDEPGWLNLVEDDVRLVLSGTVLEEAPVVRVSARTGAGLEQLVQALEHSLAERPPRPDLKRPRLPVDRIFTIPGFGTVVTGTLSDGQFRVGEEVEILPQRLRGRVRGLQTHRRKAEAALPGSRTAMNISGVNVDQIQRGDVIALPGDYQPTRRLDVRIRLLPEASQPLKHNSEVKFFIGSAESVARVRLLASEALTPGQEGWLQLELRHPVVAVRADRYILRWPSPGETLGGGIVVDPHPKGRHKRFAEGLVERFAALAKGTPAEVMMHALLALGAAPVREVTARANLEAGIAEEALIELLDSGQAVALEERGEPIKINSDVLIAGINFWEEIAQKAAGEVQHYHTSNPLRRGMPREELKSRLRVSQRLFNALINKMISEGTLAESGTFVLRPDHVVRFNRGQERAVQALLTRFAESPYTPPSAKEAQAEAGEEVYAALLDLGYLVSVSAEVVFRREDYDRMVVDVRRLLESRGTITAAEVRDHFATSRRYALALLEHLDSEGVTVRIGDARRLKQGR